MEIAPIKAVPAKQRTPQQEPPAAQANTPVRVDLAPQSLEVKGELGSIIAPPPEIQLPPERFASAERWEEQRIRALAMYCSDGRWGDAFDEFCQRSLMIPHYDRFAVPGGPAWLTARQDAAAVAKTARPEDVSLSASLSRSAWEQLGLLVKVHDLQRIILVAHYGCAFYVERYKRDADHCLPTQIEDLKRARQAVRERFPRLTVETYLAMRRGGRLSFHGNV